MRVPLSILDLAPIARGRSASDSFANSVALAQRPAREQLQGIRRVRAISLYGRGRRDQDTEDLTDEQADQLLAAGVGAQVDQMLTYAAVGTASQVSGYLDGFIRHTEADELIVAHQATTIQARLRSVTLLAAALQAVPA